LNPGTVVAIFLGERSQPLRSVSETVAVPGKGLEGDRYAAGHGTFSSWPGRGREVTLIEIEAIEDLPTACAIQPVDARRNILTRGIRLDELIGQNFAIGGVVLRGIRPCHPCDHLENLTRPGVLKALKNRGGLRAEIVSGGTLRVGQEVRPCVVPLPEAPHA
jgi:MOSC domain-containing protein YiiM